MSQEETSPPPPTLRLPHRLPHRPVKLLFWQELWDCLQEASAHRPPCQPEGTFTVDQARLALTREVIPRRADGCEIKRERALANAIGRGRKVGYWVRVQPRTWRFLTDPTTLERARFERHFAATPPSDAGCEDAAQGQP